MRRRWWGEFTVKDLPIQRLCFRGGRYIQFGRQGLDTSLVLAQSLVAAAGQGIDAHKGLVYRFIGWIARQEWRQQRNGSGIIADIAMISGQ
jgi:hypothetical protein